MADGVRQHDFLPGRQSYPRSTHSFLLDKPDDIACVIDIGRGPISGRPQWFPCATRATNDSLRHITCITQNHTIVRQGDGHNEVVDASYPRPTAILGLPQNGSRPHHGGYQDENLTLLIYVHCPCPIICDYVAEHFWRMGHVECRSLHVDFAGNVSVGANQACDSSCVVDCSRRAVGTYWPAVAIVFEGEHRE